MSRNLGSWAYLATAAKMRRSTVQPSLPASSQLPISSTARCGSAATALGHTRTGKPGDLGDAGPPISATFLSNTIACSADAARWITRTPGMTVSSQAIGAVAAPCQLGSPNTLPCHTRLRGHSGRVTADRTGGMTTAPANQPYTTDDQPLPGEVYAGHASLLLQQ